MPKKISEKDALRRAGESGYYDMVTEQNEYYRKAVEASYVRNRTLAVGMEFQRGLPEEALGNVDNGISVYNSINYQKLPHIINWNLALNRDSMKPVPLKAV